MKAVRFEQYGHSDVLNVVDLPDELPGPGQIVVAVIDAGINPGEIAIREGAAREMFPAHFPEGQGSDFSGRVVALGEGVTGFAAGDAVIGMSDERSAQAQFVVIAADRVVPKPEGLPWDVAGSLYVVATTAHANVATVQPTAADTVVVAGAAGGVGYLTAQLVRRTGARVIGIAGAASAEALRAIDVEPLEYGDGLVDRIRGVAPEGVDALIDCHGGGYVDLAAELGVNSERVNTIADFVAPRRTGAQANGMATVEQPGPVVERTAQLIADGELVFPIRARYPLDMVREAYDALGEHGIGKVVLHIGSSA